MISFDKSHCLARC